MANVKTGFDYYKIDTDRYQDRRIKKLRKNYGCVGLAVYDYLLCEIYRDKGCFAAWDEDTAFDVAEYLGIKENTVAEVVKYCGAVGLFNAELLSRGIVTSQSIQRRFVEMSIAARRSTVVIPAEICLTEESAKIQEECGDNVGRIGQNVGIMYEECGDSSNILPQSKVKYSKEKKRKESECESAHTPTHPHTQDDFVFLNFEKWCETWAPTLLQFTEPMTATQLALLRKKYSDELIQKCAAQMHNKSASKTNRSAYLTMGTWLSSMNR